MIAIKNAITHPIQAARDFCKNVASAISGFFSRMHIKLPHIKLPHFSMSGSFSIKPPSVPHISVSWYKQAMDNAMILDEPTIFGAMNGNLLGAGEAGNEVIAGERHLLNMIEQSVMTANAQQANYSNDSHLIESFKRALSEMRVEMDGDEMGKFVNKTVA